MSKEIKLFEGQEVSVTTDKGNKMYNLVHVARCCNLVKENGIKINWKSGSASVCNKLNTISSGVQTIPHQYLEEITIILDEIENTDDRNSIYMSSWLSKRLAIECHSEKANKFKNWLVTLDEARENGKLIQDSSKKENADKNSLKEKEIEARLKNARAREANVLLKICNNPNLPKEYVQVLQSKATEIITGQALLPLPKAERKTYSAEEIGEQLGITANKVGRLANANNLKTDEFGIKVWDKSKHSSKQVESFRYYVSIIPALKKLLN